MRPHELNAAIWTLALPIRHQSHILPAQLS